VKTRRAPPADLKNHMNPPLNPTNGASSDHKPSLLIVDDEREIAASIAEQFRRSYRVFTAWTGQEALKHLLENDICVIVADQRMPDMSGTQVLAQCYRLKPDTARILLTGYADIQSVIQAVNEGKIFAYLTKPWSPSELEAVVARATEHNFLLRKRQELASELQRANAELEERIRERTLELEERTLQLENSNKELEQFAYIASHDLQEPLRMVASYTQLLAKRYQGQLDEKADRYIAYAVDGAKRMQQLITDLLAFSRVTTQARQLIPTDCHAVLQLALTNLRVSISESGAEVTYDPLPTVLAEGAQLTQVFQNLIGNSLKFRGDKTPHVHISAVNNGTEWTFAVRDNGIGIDQQHAEKIFVMFQRLHTREEYPGTGIGLAIVKKIVERHGGRIWVESEVGKGTTFLFTIPGGPTFQSPAEVTDPALSLKEA
jgi:signal transduction histidine kinase